MFKKLIDMFRRDEFLTDEAAAHELNMSVNDLYEMNRRGDLRAKKQADGKLKFWREDIEILKNYEDRGFPS